MRSVKEYIDFYKNLKNTLDIDKQWDEFSRRMESYFKDFDPYEFTWGELIEIGFGKWDEEETILLIPEYLFNCIRPKTLVETTEGERIYFDQEKCIPDSKFGYLSYGVIREELKSNINTDTSI